MLARSKNCSNCSLAVLMAITGLQKDQGPCDRALAKMGKDGHREDENGSVVVASM